MTATNQADAQISLDRFCATISDARLRSPSKMLDPPDDGSSSPWPTVAELASVEPLIPLSTLPFPATIELTATVSNNATVAFRGNRYSVPPGMAGMQMTLRQRLGTESLEIFTPSGVLLVTHGLKQAGQGMIVRTPEHHSALEKTVL